MSTLAFPAKFDGTCAAGCVMRIHPGDMIRRDEALGGFVHDSCTPKPDRFTIAPNEIVCGVCWLTKPCKCDDD